jgi:hypothetical protein
MLRHFTLGSLALLGLAVGAAPGRADVFVRLPLVGVYVGPPGTFVRVPFVRVDVPNAVPVVPVQQIPVPPPPPAPVVVPPPAPVVIQPPPPVVVPPSPPPATVARPLTLNEFAASFKPAPGTYTTVLLNPITNHPVKVTFSLPPGNPRIRVFPRRLEFDYGGHRDSVEIRFDRKDRVHVQSR